MSTFTPTATLTPSNALMPASAFNSTSSIGAMARTINTAGSNPRLTAARRTTSILEGCIDECDRGLTLPREQLFDQFPEIYRQEERMAFHAKKDTRTWVSIGCMIAGCVAMTVMRNAGVAQGLVALTGVGTIAGSWIGAPILVNRALQKWVLPGDIDKRMRHKLEYNKHGFQLGLRMELERLAACESAGMAQGLNELKETVARNTIKVENGPTIVIPDDDSDFVMIDGLRLNVRNAQ
jgi:hypothetical protein